MSPEFAAKFAKISVSFEMDLMRVPEMAIAIEALASTKNGPSKEVLRAQAKDTLTRFYGLGYLAGRASMRVELEAAANQLMADLNKTIDDHMGGGT